MGAARSSVLPGENGKIAFASDERDPDGYTDYDIYNMDADGSETPTLLTDNTSTEYYPAFSPDGEKIVFSSGSDSDDDIYVMNADGSGPPTPLTEDTAVSNYDPDWGVVSGLSNDDFARARLIAGASASVSDTSVDATREAGEPEHFTGDPAQTGEHSVWYRWRVPFSGSATLDTCIADFDTILSVYTGSAVNNLTRVADDNDGCSSGSGSEVSFDAVAGTTYRIAVSGAGSAEQGTFTLDLELVDDVAPETEIDSGPSGTTSANPESFEFSSNEPDASFECSLDGAFENCSSPKEYTDLSDGSHTFEVKAVDAAGNEDASPASRTWTVNLDEAPTVTPVSPAPSSQVKSKKVLVKATIRDTPGNPARSGIRLYVDNKEVTTFSYDQATGELSYTIKKLKAGSHSVKVVAADAAGNSVTGNWGFQVKKKK